MDHGLNNDFLYSACRVEVGFSDSNGKTITGSGTAFFAKNKTGDICLVTNRHVLDIDYKKATPKYKDFKLSSLVIHVKNKDASGLPTIDNKFSIVNINEVIYHPTFENDVACIKNLTVAKMTALNAKADYFIPYELFAEKAKLIEKLVICDLVVFPGFPEWFDKKENRPILRTGTIASDPRYDYSFSGAFDGECVAYEAFSFSGSSGSPVFAIQKGIKVGAGLTGGNYREIMLVGINAGHLPVSSVIESHSGISYLYKSNVILDVINK